MTEVEQRVSKVLDKVFDSMRGQDVISVFRPKVDSIKMELADNQVPVILLISHLLNEAKIFNIARSVAKDNDACAVSVGGNDRSEVLVYIEVDERI